ncbi:MAG: hypothetical protein PHR28_04080 [candidate division Zixibacteria bacterium]|nr:hypothetical protein [candidate division Zixibacteria bacterium]
MKKLVAMLTLSFVLAIASSVSADIILSHTAVIDAMGMGGTEMVVTQKIKGEMDHTSVTSTGKGMMAGATQTAENIIISRMDKGVMWVLNPATKTYIEYPLATMKAMADAGEAQAESDSTADQEYNWTITIDTLAESTINGFACKGIKGVAEGVSLNPPGDRTRMTYEVWVGKDLPGNDELTKHYQRMSELTGQNAYSQGEMVSQILGKGEKQLRQLADAAEKLNGFPVRMEVTVATTVDLGKEMEGEAGDDSEATAMMEQVKALMKGQVGEDGLTTVVSLRSNMTKIEVVPVDAAVFDIPEGFTRGF